MIRLTIAVPAAHVPAANELAACLGSSVADRETYGPAIWADSASHSYALASTLVEPGYVEAILAPLVAPGWAVDLEAANAAQAMLVVLDLLDTDPAELTARPGRITAISHEDPAFAVAALGVHRMG